MALRLFHLSLRCDGLVGFLTVCSPASQNFGVQLSYPTCELYSTVSQHLLIKWRMILTGCLDLAGRRESSPFGMSNAAWRKRQPRHYQHGIPSHDIMKAGRRNQTLDSEPLGEFASLALMAAARDMGEHNAFLLCDLVATANESNSLDSKCWYGGRVVSLIGGHAACRALPWVLIVR